ncbi:hypothetical protein KY330_03995 [Candidatus Woesearchaeota archaeon]|nr:hypothetical protein [Candidatus Woesearchaeota archaeon]
MQPEPINKETLEQRAKNGEKAVVLMTYRSVDGFRPGMYDNGRLLIYYYNGHHDKSKPERAKAITDQFYRDFNLRQDADMFEHIFVYVGTNALEEALRAARMIGHDWKHLENSKKVTMVCCDCNLNRKRQAAHDSYTVNMILCDCGGQDTMGRIARQILEGKDPKEISDYAK